VELLKIERYNMKTKIDILIKPPIVLIILLVFTLEVRTDESSAYESVEEWQKRITAANPLPIPKILEDKNPDPDIAEFELTVMKSTTSFFEGTSTETYGYNGNYLGPVIKVRRRQEVRITIKNLLGRETTTHWHGLLVPGEMDGGPHQVIKPGKSWEAYFIIDQPAATLWYHPHPHGNIGEQVYKGLAGIFIIDDRVSEQLNIPKDYGVNDIPLVIQDRRFAPDGSLVYITNMMDTMFGMMGDIILVNGVVNPELEVGTQKIRFRIINGSNARNYRLSLNDGSTFTQIASDGGFLEYPLEINSLILVPGERAEIIIDFSKYTIGDIASLQNEGFDILKFMVNKKIKDNTTTPEMLTTIKRIPSKEATTVRNFILAGMGPMVSINGKKFNINRIDEYIKLGDTEIWQFQNIGMGMGGMMGRGMGSQMMGMRQHLGHPIHVHGVQFQILERNGKKPPLNEHGWKDTFMVYPEETVKVIMKFKYKGIYVYHCHILEHDDAGMMGNFKVE
jgi:blue copper oxidase